MDVHLNPTGNVFHDGERRMHERLGVNERLHDLGLRMIRDHMPDQHREFFEMLRSVHLGVVDNSGHPWAITRTGQPGFMQTPSDKTLTISSQPLAGEAADLELSTGAKISVLGLEMETRRRNRMNATINDATDGVKTLSVDQSYGNCPKYIQTRIARADAKTTDVNVKTRPKLSEKDRALIDAADTLMLASRAPVLGDDPRSGVDINHRGGMPGFIQVHDDQTLEFPDYKGNNFYNSFGNILLDSRVGLQMFDFESGTLLNLKGTAELIEYGDAEPPFMGRSLRVSIVSVTRAEGALPLRYEHNEFSPNNPAVPG